MDVSGWRLILIGTNSCVIVQADLSLAKLFLFHTLVPWKPALLGSGGKGCTWLY